MSSSHSGNAHDLDLDLRTGWFAKSPPKFPPDSINRLPGQRTHTSAAGWSSDGSRKTRNFTGAIRDCSTLATTIFHLTWDANNPVGTVKSKQRHVPPPKKLSPSELKSYQEKYSDLIARWCESKIGLQVGNGECWTLANDALVAVGRQFSSKGREPCMGSQLVTHCALIYSLIPAKSSHPEPCGGIREANVARGDIIQFYKAYVKSKDGREKRWAGVPDHTSIVTGILPHEILKVVEQNVGGSKRVKEGSYNMTELVQGEIIIFRAIGESWAGKLTAKW